MPGSRKIELAAGALALGLFQSMGAMAASTAITPMSMPSNMPVNGVPAMPTNVMNTAPASAPTSIPVPCAANINTGVDPTTGLRACSDVLNGGTLGPSGGSIGMNSLIASSAPVVSGPLSGAMGTTNSLVVPGMINQLSQRIQTHINGLYNGVDEDPVNFPATSGSALGHAFQQPVCDLVPSPFTGNKSETSSNHVGNSCGNPMNIDIQISGTSFSVVFNKVYPQQGTLEDGYLRGGLPQALTCYYQQVVSEIQGPNHALNITGSTGPSGPCMAFASMVGQLGNQTMGVMSSLKSHLTTQNNLSDIMNCLNDWSMTSIPDVGPLRQSAQQLCSARQSLETTFTQLAACEIFARAQRAYLDQIGSAKAQQTMLNMITTQMNQTCQAQCKKQLSIGSTVAQINQCANSCYDSQIGPYIQGYLEKLWPSNPTPTQGCST